MSVGRINNDSVLTERDSAAIRAMRVMCIFFMMSVHLYPGNDYTSFISAGAFAWFGDFWVYYLGRASVAALSLISGYLLFVVLEKRNILTVLKSRARVLLLPMIFWNVLLLSLIAVLFFMGLEDISDRAAGLNPAFALLNALTGFMGPTANNSLFFLRDLFVCTVICAYAGPIIKKWPLLAVAGTGFLALLQISAPVVFRPEILFFFTLGYAMASAQIRLSIVADKRIFVGVVSLYCASFATYFVLKGQYDIAINLENLTRRLMLISLVSFAAYKLVRFKGARHFFDTLEPIVYLAYLSHFIVTRALWTPFAFAGISADTPWYLLYFFGAPAVTFFLALKISPLVSELPGVMPIFVQGKRGARPVRAPRQAVPIPGTSSTDQLGQQKRRRSPKIWSV